MDVGVYLESPKTANTILRRWFSPAGYTACLIPRLPPP